MDPGGEGGFTQAGYLGNEPDLETLLQKDEATLKKLGITTQAITVRIRELMDLDMRLWNLANELFQTIKGELQALYQEKSDLDPEELLRLMNKKESYCTYIYFVPQITFEDAILNTSGTFEITEDRQRGYISTLHLKDSEIKYECSSIPNMGPTPCPFYLERLPQDQRCPPDRDQQSDWRISRGGREVTFSRHAFHLFEAHGFAEGSDLTGRKQRAGTGTYKFAPGGDFRLDIACAAYVFDIKPGDRAHKCAFFGPSAEPYELTVPRPFSMGLDLPQPLEEAPPETSQIGLEPPKEIKVARRKRKKLKDRCTVS